MGRSLNNKSFRMMQKEKQMKVAKLNRDSLHYCMERKKLSEDSYWAKFVRPKGATDARQDDEMA